MKKSLLVGILTFATVASVRGAAQIEIYNFDFQDVGRTLYGANSGGKVGAGVVTASHFKVGLYYAVGNFTNVANAAMAGDGGNGLIPFLTLGTGTGSVAGIGSDGPGIYSYVDPFPIPGTTTNTNVTVVLVAYNGSNYVSSQIRGHSSAFLMPAHTPQFFPDLTGFYADDIYVKPVGFNVEIQPSDAVVTGGTGVNLNTIATNWAFDCQWRLNGTNISGASGTNYFIPNVSLADAGTYDVIATNSLGSVTSSPAILQVLLPGAPSINVNGRPVVGTILSAMPASVVISNRLPTGTVYYTLNGSAPSTNSPLYADTLSLSNNAVIRAIRVTSDFSQQVEAFPVTLVILPTYPLTITTTGSGSVALFPTNAPYLSNTVVLVEAVDPIRWGSDPKSWWFSHWSGDLFGSANPTTIAMTGPRSVQAVFTAVTHPLVVYTVGGGAVSIDPWRPFGNNGMPEGSVVSLAATPASGWSFLRWQGTTNSIANPLGLTLVRPNTNAAIFGTTIGTNITGSGSIGISPANPAEYGTTNTITAYPAPGHRFVSWSQAVSGTNNPTPLRVTNANPVVGALFAPLANPPNVSVGLYSNGVYAGVTIGGVAGNTYGIEYATDLGANSWQTLTNITLQQPVELWIDMNTDMRSSSCGYYRAYTAP